MRIRVYNFLVNRHPGIRERYHRFHDGASGWKKNISWLYLLALNFCYYILFCHFLDKQQEVIDYEETKTFINRSESEIAAAECPDAEELLERLLAYDVISFDIFDTLIFRPFSEPTDLFFFVGEKMEFMDFKRIRTEMEMRTRETCWKKNRHMEVTLEEIWKTIQRETGMDAERGMCMEMETELEFCFANPFMLDIYQKLLEKGKKVILISDMYLPETFLRKLLQKCGYAGTEEMFVSCEHGKNKASGTLFALAKSRMGKDRRIIHVGDNPVSDIKMAQEAGFASCYYPNVNRSSRQYRSYDMSAVIGGAYRGVVNQYLYRGTGTYTMEYEYGFVYGGLFVLGYCNYIHEYCQKNGIDKILFLARDGDILKQVYERVFPGENTEYVYWSRAAATKLMAAHNTYDYYRRFLYHKVNQKYTLEKIFGSMELRHLLERLPSGLHKSDFLTNKNVEAVKKFLNDNWEVVLQSYEEGNVAAKEYYTGVLAGCRKACAVDIGWAGSGAMALDYLVERVWKIPCEVVGVLAGTNTIHNVEPDASEMFLQSGKLSAYLYSQSMNRDLLKKHDPNRDYNVFWELLLASPSRTFKGFCRGKDGKGVDFCFGEPDENLEGIRQIQQGILDFVEEYRKHFGTRPYMLCISGRDAYAPMLAAAGDQEKYLKAIRDKFVFDISVG